MAKTKNEQVESSKQSTKATPVDNKVDSSKIDKSKEATKVDSKKPEKTLSTFLKARTKTQWAVGFVLLVAIYGICRAPDNVEFRDLSKEVESIKTDIKDKVKVDITAIETDIKDKVKVDITAIETDIKDKVKVDITAIEADIKNNIKSDIADNKEKIKINNDNFFILDEKVNNNTSSIKKLRHTDAKINAKVNEVVDTVNVINNNTKALRKVQCDKWFNDKLLCTDEQGFKSLKTIKKLK
jgi:hypothetical protein